MKRPLKPGVFGAAQFEMSDGVRVGRIRLDRWWDPTLTLGAFGRPDDDRYRPLVVIGINPSDACDKEDDNTSAKCTTYAKREGANGLLMVNLTPEITDDPDELGRVLMPYGCDGRHWEAVDEVLSENVAAVLAAWGKPPRSLSSYRERVAKVKDIAADVGRDLMCFGTNEGGSPKHPLYLKASVPIVPWWRHR
jgi:hypothetical protein